MRCGGCRRGATGAGPAAAGALIPAHPAHRPLLHAPAASLLDRTQAWHCSRSSKTAWRAAPACTATSSWRAWRPRWRVMRAGRPARRAGGRCGAGGWLAGLRAACSTLPCPALSLLLPTLTLAHPHCSTGGVCQTRRGGGGGGARGARGAWLLARRGGAGGRRLCAKVAGHGGDRKQVGEVGLGSCRGCLPAWLVAGRRLVVGPACHIPASSGVLPSPARRPACRREVGKDFGNTPSGRAVLQSSFTQVRRACCCCGVPAAAKAQGMLHSRLSAQRARHITCRVSPAISIHSLSPLLFNPRSCCCTTIGSWSSASARGPPAWAWRSRQSHW